MRRSEFAVALLPLFLLAACAAAPDAPPPVTAAAPANSARPVEIAQVREIRPDPESPDDLICSRETRVGSHFPVRVCYTRAELEARRLESQEAIRNLPPTVNIGRDEPGLSDFPRP
jgi:hypothetical protein